MEPGTLVTGKMVSALKQIGFDKVFDTNFAADLTIMEEGTELLTRLKNVLVVMVMPLFLSSQAARRAGLIIWNTFILNLWKMYQPVNLPSRCLVLSQRVIMQRKTI